MKGYTVFPRLAYDKVDRLRGVHPELCACLIIAAHEWHTLNGGFVRFNEGLRSPDRQAQLVRAGSSWTMDSKHLDGMAVDVALFPGGSLSWDLDYYRDYADMVESASFDLGVRIEWGGNWKVRDGPHFQLDG